MSSLSLRMVSREARAAGGKFVFVILAVAAGVGALTGVRGFSQAFRTALLREARTLMAADLSVRSFTPPSPRQEALLSQLAAQGVGVTNVVETLSMMSSGKAGYPVMVSLKAVDPKVYPFYGWVRLDPPQPLSDALTDSTVAVSDDLLLRLGNHVGDTVKLGSAEFRIAGVVRMEPDRMTGSLNVGPRLMMSREALARAGLMKLGSRASYRILLKLESATPSVAEVRRRLERAFREGSRIADYRETHPAITRGLERSTTFLSLVSLIALIVGGLGVATAMHSHLQQKLDTIGILKCLGARSGQIIRIYLVQALALGFAGSILGILVSFLVQAEFPRLLANYFALPVGIQWRSGAALEGFGVGILTTLLFTLPPLLQIRKIRPLDVFRREMPEAHAGGWRARLSGAAVSLATGALILAGLAFIAGWLAGSRRTGVIFLGGVVVSLAVLSLVAWLLLRLLRALPALLPWRLPTVLRHGIANLHRPGAHSGAVLVALGIGVTFTATVYLIQRSLLAEFVRTAPRDMPNVFFINIMGPERDGIVDILRKHPGVEDAPVPTPAISGRLVAVDGVPLDRRRLQGWGRRFLSPRYVTWARDQPKNTELVQGAWWKTVPQSPEIAVDDDAAHVLEIGPGARLDWQIAGRPISALVAAVTRGQVARFGASLEFVFSPGALDGLPAVYFATARVQPAQVPALQKKVFDQFPTVTVINAADVLQIVQQVIDQIALVVRFISAFTILGGVIILAAGISGTRFRRIREVTILKTLGATRGRVARIFSVEFLVLGAVAGLIGSLLAAGLSSVLLRRLLDATLQLDWRATVVAIGATAFIANLAGWIVSFRILGQKPLEILRQE